MLHEPRPLLRKFAVRAALAALPFALALDFTRPALAYLDPGTGSIMLQLVLGGVAGGLVVCRLYWQKLKGLFARAAGKKNLQANHKAPGE